MSAQSPVAPPYADPFTPESVGETAPMLRPLT